MNKKIEGQIDLLKFRVKELEKTKNKNELKEQIKIMKSDIETLDMYYKKGKN